MARLRRKTSGKSGRKLEKSILRPKLALCLLHRKFPKKMEKRLFEYGKSEERGKCKHLTSLLVLQVTAGSASSHHTYHKVGRAKIDVIF